MKRPKLTKQQALEFRGRYRKEYVHSLEMPELYKDVNALLK